MKEAVAVGSKVVTVRLPEDQSVALETVARFDGVALAEEIREGVELLLAARRNDPEFIERVRESFKQARDLLAEVEGAGAVIEVLRTPDGAQSVAAEQRASVAQSG
jgi:hypothetical protein